MRGLLATSIGVTCAASLALPLTPSATAVTARPAPTAETATAAALATSPAAPLPGSTQSLPLTPLTRDRARAGAGAEQGVTRRDVRPFSLLGIVWDDPDAELDGRVQVRTRDAKTRAWSGWRDVETHNADHGADPDAAERSSGRVRGATAPLWVGDSDGVELRVRPAAGHRTEDTARGVRTAASVAPLPAGLSLELVDPGTAAPAPATRMLTTRAATASGTSAATEIPALSREATERDLLAHPGAPLSPGQRAAKPYIGPRPNIVTRRGWGADESLRESGFRYTTTVKAAFVHHTASGNNYTCAQAPSVIRGIYRYHVKSLGWRDIGYNFLVDKCGTLYEGRAGGVTKAVMGAHTLGFNSNSMGIAAIGTYTSTKPSAATVKAIASLTAWKLGLFGGNPKGKTYLKSGGGNLYAKGKNVRLNVISGHRDGFATECPGRQLYGKLASARTTAARYQGR
ncbi:peptidoglycan recognition protein [Streptomyces sp. BK239]|uniref:peptidoglycan recognition protein family protein n=1 Tax=Streptomyces sp. BK239 TaxID=2512155 RepID=UPI00102CDBF0|nr:peptidoglycan recognition protein [Streptomyces sp. BK239]